MKNGDCRNKVKIEYDDLVVLDIDTIIILVAETQDSCNFETYRTLFS